MRHHPAYLAEPGDREAIRAYFAWEGGGMAHGPLPFTGGYAEQPAALMDLFDGLAGVRGRLRKK